MKTVMLVVLILSLPLGAWSQLPEESARKYRKAWYFDFTTGSNLHFPLDKIDNDYPNGVSTEAHGTLLNELDFGYRFKKRFTLGLGFEFNNFVSVEYKLDFKWSFFIDSDIQPYTYTCIHGGLTDLPMMGIHVGYGVDFFIQDRTYIIVDARVGPSWGSGDPFIDPDTNEYNMDMHIEGALSFGFGLLLKKKS